MQINHKRTTYSIAIVLAHSLLVTSSVLAGNIDSGAAPGATSSYTLSDIYNRLDAGTAGAQSTFTEPAAGPGSTMNTLNDIMGKAPAVDNTNGATADQVKEGTTFWGLNVTSGEWGLQTGTLVIPQNVTAIVMYSGGASNGNLGGRAGADTLCQNNLPTGLGTEYIHFRAFISVDAADEIRDMPSNYAVPTDLPITGPIGATIANDWAALLNSEAEPLLSSFSAAGITHSSNTWWSGSAGGIFPPQDGAVNVAETCEDGGGGGWSNGAGGGNHGGAGSLIAVEGGVFDGPISMDIEFGCDTDRPVLCIAY